MSQTSHAPTKTDAMSSAGQGDEPTPRALARVNPEAMTDATRCRNCGATLNGAFCHDCGQSSHIHRSLSGIGHDLAHGVFHFEGKVWDTIPMLAWHPGELTRRYVMGQRARFISPLALFLFAVFMAFAVATLASKFEAGDPATNPIRVEAQGKTLTTTEQLDARKQELDRAIAAAKAAGKSAAQLEEERAGIEIAQGITGTFDPSAGTGQVRGNLNVPQWLEDMIIHARDDPALFFYKVQSNGYKFAWAVILLSVPLVWLLFATDRRVKLYDHYVFVTYSVAAMLLLFSLVSLWGVTNIATGLVMFAAILFVPVHMFRHVRGAYALSSGQALWRTALLVIMAIIVSLVFIALLFALGAS